MNKNLPGIRVSSCHYLLQAYWLNGILKSRSWLSLDIMTSHTNLPDSSTKKLKAGKLWRLAMLEALKKWQTGSWILQEEDATRYPIHSYAWQNGSTIFHFTPVFCSSFLPQPLFFPFLVRSPSRNGNERVTLKISSWSNLNPQFHGVLRTGVQNMFNTF